MPKITNLDLLKLQKTLKTDAAIGAKLGVTRQYVHDMRKLYGIPSSRGDVTARNNKIIAMYKSGMTAARVTKKLDVSLRLVYKVVSLAGVKKNHPKAKLKIRMERFMWKAGDIVFIKNSKDI